MTGIFINYRREDAPGVAGRLFDRLSSKFAKHEMFMDVDAMKPGIDFAKQIEEQVSKCAVVLAIIGPGWLGATDEKGRRRLDLPRDHVRIELAAALKREIPVIPVLVNGTTMPGEDELPDDLKSLPHRHALELRHSRFPADSEAVIHALQGILRRRNRWPLLAASIAGLIALALLAWNVDFAALQRTMTSAAWTTHEPAGTPAPVVVLKASPTASPSPSPVPGSKDPPATPPAYLSGDRVALVIGNSNYPDADAPLKTPINDAKLMARGLMQANFTVTSGQNLSAIAMRQTLDKFYSSLKPGAIAILFYSGYAIQSNRQNYLIPVDAQVWTEADVQRDGINLEVVLEQIHRGGATLKIALIDGSRRNPFERRFRAQSQGLTAVSAPMGTMVMYSTAVNVVQNDGGSDDNSLFVTELLKNVGIPNINAQQALTQTRFAISSATRLEQVPWIADETPQGFDLVSSPSSKR